MRLLRLLLLSALALVLVAAPATAAVPSALPVLAQVAQGPLAQEGPAVEVPDEAPEDEEDPWTSKYLIPTTLAIGALAVAGVAIVYFARVVARYRVSR